MAPVTHSWVHKLNVVRYEILAEREPDPELKTRLQKLLADERALLTLSLEGEAAPSNAATPRASPAQKPH